jgi:hypothetical protein
MIRFEPPPVTPDHLLLWPEHVELYRTDPEFHASIDSACHMLTVMIPALVQGLEREAKDRRDRDLLLETIRNHPLPIPKDLA